MSDVSTPSAENKPEEAKADQAKTEEAKPAPAPAAASEKPAPPAEPVEPPFTVDELISCTSRFTNKAWYLFYNNQKDMDFIRNTPVRATLEIRSGNEAEEIQRQLIEAGAQSISRQDKTLSFTATFEAIQTVIKKPEIVKLDAVKI